MELYDDQPSILINAEQLLLGDVFPSHDEQTHMVRRITTLGAMESEAIRVQVERSDGSIYTTTFAPFDVVRVIA